MLNFSSSKIRNRNGADKFAANPDNSVDGAAVVVSNNPPATRQRGLSGLLGNNLELIYV
jgi:hypothetical protein